MDSRITKMSRAILASMTNANDTLFGGTLLSWMDEISGIAAGRYANSMVTTVAIEKVSFIKPIYKGEFIDIEARILSVGNTSIRVMIKVLIDKEDGKQEFAAESIFVYVALDEHGKPKKVVKEK